MRTCLLFILILAGGFSCTASADAQATPTPQATPEVSPSPSAAPSPSVMPPSISPSPTAAPAASDTPLPSPSASASASPAPNAGPGSVVQPASHVPGLDVLKNQPKAPSAAAAAISIDIDLSLQKAFLIQDGKIISETPISSGKPGRRTPTGNFQVLQKDLNHLSSLYGKIVNSRGVVVVRDADALNPIPPGEKFVAAPMHYFLRFDGAVGMHAGKLPGYPASHGCVRLPREKALLFYNTALVGSVVRVHGEPPEGHAEIDRPRHTARPQPASAMKPIAPVPPPPPVRTTWFGRPLPQPTPTPYPRFLSR